MDELGGHPEGWNSRGDGDAFGDVAAADYTPKPCGEVDSGNNPITNPPCPNCGSTARRSGPSSGPHQIPPPYGRKLSNRFASGWKPANKTVFIAAGSDAWRVAHRWDSEPGRRALLSLPPDADPSIFDWGVVSGFDCVVFAAGDVIEGIIDQLAAHLLRAGAGSVVACGDNMSMIAYRLEKRA
jgi:hypothetical protein